VRGRLTAAKMSQLGLRLAADSLSALVVNVCKCGKSGRLLAWPDTWGSRAAVSHWVGVL
jgi:hypothetical protein